jgi:Ca2+-binding EF-hand superfamily protein
MAAAHGKTITVALNGNFTFTPVKIVLNGRNNRSLVTVLDEIGKKFRKVSVETVTKLISEEGKLIRQLDSLEDHGRYIAVTRGRFKRGPYFSNQLPTSHRASPVKAATVSHIRTHNSPIKKKVVSTTPRRQLQQDLNPSSSQQVTPVKKKLAPEERVQAYNVVIVTGDDDGCGTDANVYLTIHGTKGTSPRTALREDSDNFEAGAEDVFAVECPGVGEITAITIEQDNSGASSAWFLESVSVRDVISGKKSTFEFHDWVASDRGNMECKVRLETNTPVNGAQPTAISDDIFAAKANGDDADTVDDTDETQQDELVDAKRAEVVGEFDDTPSISTGKFKEAEATIKAAMNDAKELKSYWKQMDFNGNGIVSLAEIDKFVVEKFPVLNSKPAIMRAYKKTTLKDGDGDAWVEKKEFPAFLRNLLYFNCLFDAFDQIDTDDDRRVDFDEFKKGLKVLDMNMDDENIQIEFNLMDGNGGGYVLFDEFAAWASEQECPVNGDVMKEFTTSED